VTYPALEVHHVEADFLLAALDDFSPTAIEEHDHVVMVYFSSTRARDLAGAAVARSYPAARVSRREVDDEDWARRSQENLQPITIGRLTVLPRESLTPTPGSLVPIAQSLVIRPSMGFGTGHHATTRLCLEALQTLDLSGAFVLDVGTGSGILALAARRLGARHALGIDSDPDAIQSANENLQLNPDLSDVSFLLADLTTWLGIEARDGAGTRTGAATKDGAARDDSADVMLANLTGALLVRVAPLLVAGLEPGGRLIVSGLLQHERAEVVAAFEPWAELAWEGGEDEWRGLMLTKKLKKP